MPAQTIRLMKRRCDRCNKFNPPKDLICNWCCKPTRRGVNRPVPAFGKPARPATRKEPRKEAPRTAAKPPGKGKPPAPAVRPGKPPLNANAGRSAKPAAPPPAARKGKPPATTTCITCTGDRAFLLHPVADMVANKNGRKMCPRCAGLDTPAAAEESLGTWFVLQVEPGKESTVRADILKRVKINNLEKRIRRVMSPSVLVERVGPKVGDTLAEGTVPGNPDRATYDAAKEAAKQAARDIYAAAEGGEAADYDNMDTFPGLRLQCFPGKKAGTVDWKVKEVRELETVRRVVKARKFPGYMLVNMDYDVTTAHLIKQVRHQWGLLLQPVVTGHLIKLTERTSQNALPGQELGWNWRVVTPDGKTCVAKGRHVDKGAARCAAEAAKAKAEEFKPTAMESQEAAELLIAQKAVNQIVKDKEELNKAVVNLRPGDKVRVKAGAFNGCPGEVVRLLKNKKDKRDVKVVLRLRILGVDVPATLDHHEVERTTRGDR